MSAPNAQPAGSRPAPGKVNTHAPHQGGMPSNGPAVGPTGQGVAPHGTPGKVGANKKNPLR
jgi:hypothetical protein